LTKSETMQTTSPFGFQMFTHEQVKEINKKVKEHIVHEQDPAHAANHATKTGEFSNVPCRPLMNLIHPWLYQCQLTNRNVFGFDVYWDFHLEGLNYNVYKMNDEYTWHIDATKEQKLDMKLTCLLNLSEEPYEGGEFCIINSNENVKFTSGMGLIFNPLIAHKVTPVTKGERITLTYWASGPLWR